MPLLLHNRWCVNDVVWLVVWWLGKEDIGGKQRYSREENDVGGKKDMVLREERYRRDDEDLAGSLEAEAGSRTKIYWRESSTFSSLVMLMLTIAATVDVTLGRYSYYFCMDDTPEQSSNLTTCRAHPLKLGTSLTTATIMMVTKVTGNRTLPPSTSARAITYSPTSSSSHIMFGPPSLVLVSLD